MISTYDTLQWVALPDKMSQKFANWRLVWKLSKNLSSKGGDKLHKLNNKLKWSSRSQKNDMSATFKVAKEIVFVKEGDQVL